MAIAGYVALGKDLQGNVMLVGLEDSGQTNDAGDPIYTLATANDTLAASIGQIGDTAEDGTVIGLLQGILDAVST